MQEGGIFYYDKLILATGSFLNFPLYKELMRLILLFLKPWITPSVFPKKSKLEKK
jgi:hypothetical protein